MAESVVCPKAMLLLLLCHLQVHPLCSNAPVPVRWRCHRLTGTAVIATTVLQPFTLHKPFDVAHGCPPGECLYALPPLVCSGRFTTVLRNAQQLGQLPFDWLSPPMCNKAAYSPQSSRQEISHGSNRVKGKRESFHQKYEAFRLGRCPKTASAEEARTHRVWRWMCFGLLLAPHIDMWTLETLG